jgi:hypothetical protein
VENPHNASVPAPINYGGANTGFPFRTRDRRATQPTLDFGFWLLTSQEHQDFFADYMVPIRQSSFGKVADPLLFWMLEHWFPTARWRVEQGGGVVMEVLSELAIVLQKVFTDVPPAQATQEFCKNIMELEWVVPS